VKVLIVGGGIIGCAAAYELARAGCRVTVFERATPGAEASSAAAGLLAPIDESTETNFARLALASWRLYPDVVRDLQERTGIDVEYVTRGTIYPTSAAQKPRDVAQWADLEEFGVERLDGDELHRREPALSPKIRHAIFVEGDHWLNNQRLVLAYAQAAVSAGVELRTGCNVSRLIVESGRARTVVTEGERIDGDAVLLAAGAWSSELMTALGAPLRIEPRRGQMIALAHVPSVVTHCVHGEVYLVPRPSGELLIGATVERAGFQRAVTAEGIAGLLRAAIELVPSLGDLPIARTWCGFRPWAPDSLPVLGPWPGVEGLFVATGHFRNGILLAPITARLMTEWITGREPSLAVKDFRPGRFVSGARRNGSLDSSVGA
jgi:glycine oxidase